MKFSNLLAFTTLAVASPIIRQETPLAPSTRLSSRSTRSSPPMSAPSVRPTPPHILHRNTDTPRTEKGVESIEGVVDPAPSTRSRRPSRTPSQPSPPASRRPPPPSSRSPPTPSAVSPASSSPSPRTGPTRSATPSPPPSRSSPTCSLPSTPPPRT